MARPSCAIALRAPSTIAMMPAQMPTAPTQTLQFGQFMLVDVVDYEPDGTTPDTTEALSVISGNQSFATATVDPANNRRIKITGVAPGSTNVTVNASGVPSTGLLVIPVTVTSPPPNLSRIDFASASGPF